ncbi:hypothetical protein Mapa_003184 [Marchantia paleacea]|nr:hypothetical protein Mapa_003184 [Marchantia paleacea]
MFIPDENTELHAMIVLHIILVRQFASVINGPLNKYRMVAFSSMLIVAGMRLITSFHSFQRIDNVVTGTPVIWVVVGDKSTSFIFKDSHKNVRNFAGNQLRSSQVY